jgi:hypothetical protein
MSLENLLKEEAYSLPQNAKGTFLLEHLNALTEHHYENCDFYRSVIDGIWGGQTKARLISEVPYLPVGLFKKQKLASISQDYISMTLTSSGTTGAAVSQIYIDKETSMRQQKALAQSMAHILGPKRLPMLVIDSSAVFKNPAMMSARGAGVLGMMRFGHRPVFALDKNMELNLDGVHRFLEKSGNSPFFVFGFTFMVWSHLYERFKSANVDLRNGILVHSGGWKKMAEQAVDNKVFRERLGDSFNLTNIYNFYGMAEQLGSVFLEGEDGLLYPPSFSEVIISNPKTWVECALGEPGIIQVLSLIPLSYPGHSLLTEDIGVIENLSNNGRFKGKGLRIIGRVKKAELRGCSDIVATAA